MTTFFVIVLAFPESLKYGLVIRLVPHRPLKLMAMPPYQLTTFRRKGRFESPIDYVRAIIPFTFSTHG